MVSVENILDFRFLGFIEPVMGNNDNARITVLGYKDTDNEYIAFNKLEARNLFTPDGKVFAPKFEFNHEGANISPNSFIEFNVRQSFKDASFRGDDYIMDYSCNITSKYFISIIPVNYQTSLENGFITQDELQSCITKQQLENCSSYFFLKYSDKLYGLFKFDESSNSIKPISGKHAGIYEIIPALYKKECISIHNNEWFMGKFNQIPFRQIGIIDCMDDKQLGDWFKDQLKALTISEPLLQIDKEVIKEFVTHNKETNDLIDEIRLERIKGKLDSLNFNFKEMQELLNVDSDLTKNLKRIILDMKDEYHDSWAKELEYEKEKLQTEVNTLTEKKEKLEQDTSNANSLYTQKIKTLEEDFINKKESYNKELKETEDKLNNIKENYEGILSVLQTYLPKNSKHNDTSIKVTPITFEQRGDSFSYLEEEEGYGFFSSLKLNLELEEIPDFLQSQMNQRSTLFTKQACFIPSVSWAYLYAKAIRNSKLFTIHVEHDWLHYSDFLDNGLSDIVESCYENENINHIVVFDSLNLTQPECGLKPLLDAISGYSLVLPQINKVIPQNLKIFATVVPFDDDSKVGITLSKDTFFNWGQIATRNDKIILANDFFDIDSYTVYFEPKDFHIDFLPDDGDINEYFK